MSRKPRETPAMIAAKLMTKRKQDFEAVNLSPDTAALLQNADIEITRAGQKRAGQTVKDDSARRLDAFAALKEGMDKGAYDAARRLERDMLVRRGEGDRGRILERVDGDAPHDHTDRIVQAGETCEYIKSRLSRRDWWLLNELIAPSREHAKGWRDAVFYVTGEANAHAQGAAVRAASSNLRDAYEDLDAARVRRAA